MNLIVYNKAQEEDPIKNGNLVSDIQIDHHNHIYLAIDNSIFVYDIRRIADKKDNLIDIVHVNSLAPAQPQVIRNMDPITKVIHEKGFSEAIDYVLQQDSRGEIQNKFLDVVHIKKRIEFLKGSSKKIRSISLAKNPKTEPLQGNIVVHFTDHTMSLLVSKANKNAYRCHFQQQQHPIYKAGGVQVAKYIDHNSILLSISVNNNMTQVNIINDKDNQLIITYTVPLVTAIAVQSIYSHLILLLWDRVGILTKNGLVLKELSLPVRCDYMNATQSHIYLGSFDKAFVIDIKDYSVKQTHSFPIQKVVLYDSGHFLTCQNFIPNTRIKHCARTTNHMFVLIGNENGSNHKYTNMIICVDDEDQLLENCLQNLVSFIHSPSGPMNYSDLRLLNSKVLNRLTHRISVLYNFLEKKELRIETEDNKDQEEYNAQKYIDVLKDLPIDWQKMIVAKFLYNLLIINSEMKQAKIIEDFLISFVKKRMEERRKGTEIPLSTQYIRTHCIYTLENLGDQDLVECRQCGVYGKKAYSQRHCYVCWGEMAQVRIF